MAEKVKKSSRKKKTPRFISRADFLRMQVVAAETVWKEAKEHFSHAKRRRKLAKLLAKRAKTDVKRAKVQLAKLREALTWAEAHESSAKKPAARRKNRKLRAAAKVPLTKKKKTKNVRMIRAPKIAGPPPVPVLTEAAIRQISERTSQASPAMPGQG